MFSRGGNAERHEKTCKSPCVWTVCCKVDLGATEATQAGGEQVSIMVKKFPCSYCNKTFSRNSSAKRHEKICQRPRKSEWRVCKKCRKTCQSHSSRLEHEKTCNGGPDSFPCTSCGAIFSSREQLMEHELTYKHSSPVDLGATEATQAGGEQVSIMVKKFPCSYCNKTFSRNSSAKRHEKICQRPRKSEWRVCKKCRKTCQSHSSRLEHEKTCNGGPDSFPCTSCGAIFSSREQLMEHELTYKHSSPVDLGATEATQAGGEQVSIMVKKFPCSYCNKTFSRNSSAKRHEKICQRPRKSEWRVCKKCRKTCQSHSTRLEHEKTCNGGPDSFPCTSCGAIFSSREQLMEHELTYKHSTPGLGCSHSLGSPTVIVMEKPCLSNSTFVPTDQSTSITSEQKNLSDSTFVPTDQYSNISCEQKHLSNSTFVPTDQSSNISCEQKHLSNSTFVPTDQSTSINYEQKHLPDSTFVLTDQSTSINYEQKHLSNSTFVPTDQYSNISCEQKHLSNSTFVSTDPSTNITSEQKHLSHSTFVPTDPYTNITKDYDSTDLDTDDDIVELPPLANHVSHEIFDLANDKDAPVHASNSDPIVSKENLPKRSFNANKEKDVDKYTSVKKLLETNLEHRTVNLEHRTVNLEHRTVNLEHRTVNLELKFKCDFCQRWFRNNSDVITHMKSHGFIQDENLIPCDLCNKYLPTEVEVMVHRQDKHGVCSVCNVTLASADIVPQHLDTHTHPTLQRCLICGSGFLARVALLHHLKDQHREQCHQQQLYDTISKLAMLTDHYRLHVFSFKCPYCGAVFSKKQECLDHVQNHYTEGHLKCKQCPKEFECRKDLMKHSLVHSKDERIQCEVCTTRFFYVSKRLCKHSRCHKRIFCCRLCGSNAYDNSSELLAHMIKHASSKEIKCVNCYKQFSCYKSFEEHKNKQHHFQQSYKCAHCDMVYKTKNTLRRHEREKHVSLKDSEKQACALCEKTFNCKSSLRRHMTQQHRPKTIKCPSCPRMFDSIPKLKRHEVIHTAERKYVCDICQKSFVHRNYLSLHKLFHSDTRAHKCSECDKSFKTKSQLNYHMHTHTGNRPYVCDICGRGFTNQTHKKTHMRTHTGETPYLCHSCGAAFPTNAQLKNHALKHQ